MNFEQNTGKSIQEAFEEYHKANPKVYAHFCRLAFQAIRAGRKQISFRAILNVIRWEVFLQPEPDDKATVTTEGDQIRKFKINDAYSPHYARLFVKEFPMYESYIEFRRLRAGEEDKPQGALTVPLGGPVGCVKDFQQNPMFD